MPESKLQQIPNALTILRIVLAAAFPLVPAEWRVAVLGAALLTEFLDGVLARKFGWESRLGRILDPIADRCLFVSVIVTLLIVDAVTPLQLAALGARDLLVVAGTLVLIALGERRVLKRMRPRAAGKLTTALQYVALLCVVLGAGLPELLLVATAAIGLFAAAQYLADAHRLRQ